MIYLSCNQEIINERKKLNETINNLYYLKCNQCYNADY